VIEFRLKHRKSLMESAPPVTAQPPPAQSVGPKPKQDSPIETALSSSIGLLVLPGRSVLALMPLWSVLCGAWMAYVQAARATRSPQALLALLLAVSIVGVLWSTWRALLVDVDWAGCFRLYPLPAPRLLSGLPYTTPWSPLGRLFARSNQLRRWSQEVPVEIRSAWYTTLVLPALILVLSALAGWPLTALSIATLALSLIEARTSRRTSRRREQRDPVHTALRAGMQVGLGWLAGYAVLAPLTWTAVTLACCYALAYQGALRLAQRTLEPDRRNSALLVLYGGQAAALTLLVLLGRPLTAAFAAFLLAPQWLLLAGLGPRQEADAADRPAHAWYLQRALPFCMIAMFAAAWAPL
jgi:hypothetical protein